MNVTYMKLLCAFICTLHQHVSPRLLLFRLCLVTPSALFRQTLVWFAYVHNINFPGSCREGFCPCLCTACGNSGGGFVSEKWKWRPVNQAYLQEGLY